MVWDLFGVHWGFARFAIASPGPGLHLAVMSATPTRSLTLTSVHVPLRAEPAELTAAAELARLTDARVSPGARPGRGVAVALASRRWARRLPTAARDHSAWMWLRITPEGSGEICATHGSFLYAAVRLLANGVTELSQEKLARGVLLPATFGWHRPLFDACYAQYWRSARNFDRDRYAATLAESGFTHLEVNSLQAHLPHEDFVPFEYYPQFYTYAPGFNHFVDTELTRGIWPAFYLDANLNHLKSLAEIGRRYGLKPGVCMFEPRSMPERFFTKYPTLRGARVDHPFRSRLPRYTMAQDHPIVCRHYREALQALMRAVPDLSYMSVWTNDSGAGFEHTASLYVGRNGGPYMIREWRNHDKVAEAAGQSIVRYLHNLRAAAAEINPDFDVILRIEPFKVEHDHIKRGMNEHVTWEAPSLLVRGYALPYPHPKYPENTGVAGSIFHSWLDADEAKPLAASREQGAEPALNYAASGVNNHEPLLGLPFPRLLHQKLTAMRQLGLQRASCMGGLANAPQAPYWPNAAVIQAAQFFPEKPVDTVLTEFATRCIGSEHANALTAAWREFEEALVWQPLVGLYCVFGFCWQRTWDRPIVPDIEAIPASERAYYERHGCFQHNNPSLGDLGKDVLFDLMTRESAAKMSGDMDRQLLPRVRRVRQKLEALVSQTSGQPQVVFADLRDRVRAYQHWATALRNVCAWCDCVYSYLATPRAAGRRAQQKRLQAVIDLDLANTRQLIELLETTKTEVLVLSQVADNTFMYGENLVENLRTKLRLTAKYRHLPPRIDPDAYWRPIPGTHWPKGWA